MTFKLIFNALVALNIVTILLLITVGETRATNFEFRFLDVAQGLYAGACGCW